MHGAGQAVQEAALRSLEHALHISSARPGHRLGNLEHRLRWHGSINSRPIPLSFKESKMSRPVRLLSLLALLSIASPVPAADPVTEAIQQAYAPYREALYKTNGQSQAEALAALDRARQQWQALVAAYAGKPSQPYARDPQFAASLQAVGRVYDEARAKIDAHQLGEAHHALEAARDILADLRHRNGIVVYSDHMNAYHSQMEHVLDSSARLLEEKQGQLKLMSEVGVLAFLARRLDAEASAELKANGQFVTLLKAVGEAVSRLEAAVLTGDAQEIRASLQGLKKPYSKLFVQFG